MPKHAPLLLIGCLLGLLVPALLRAQEGQATTTEHKLITPSRQPLTRQQLHHEAPDGLFAYSVDSSALRRPTAGEVRVLPAHDDPAGMRIISPVYQFDLEDDGAVDTSLPLRLTIKYTEESTASKSLYYFDRVRRSWVRLPSYHHVEDRTVSAPIHLAYAEVAVIADSSREDGIASWYAYKGCLCAASRIYPKGSRVKVTRLKSGRSVIVRINDFGPEEWTGRLIDLDRTAFRSLGSLRAGLIYVRVEPYD